jgi:hypothetical protein
MAVITALGMPYRLMACLERQQCQVLPSSSRV